MIILLSLALAPAAAQDTPPETPPVPDVDIYGVSAAELLTDLSGLYRAASKAYNDADYETAAAYYIELISHDGHNDTAMYNLACCYGLLGRVDLAKELIDAAVAEGFSELWQLEYDPDLQSVRDTEGFDEFYAGLEAQIDARRAGLGETLYFEAPMYLRCRVMYPADYDPSRHYTLLVGLHGFGADTAGFMKVWERFAGRDFIFALPQAPYAFNSGLPDPGFSWGWWLSGEGLPRASWAMSEQYVADVIDRLQTTLPVEKTYVLGFSQGAAMSYCVGINHRTLVDGIIPFGGWLDENYIGISALTDGAGPAASP
jgi:tetratricopeptide (TPR) repeat protein